jgi:hypothetical protein
VHGLYIVDIFIYLLHFRPPELEHYSIWLMEDRFNRIFLPEKHSQAKLRASTAVCSGRIRIPASLVCEKNGVRSWVG